MSQNFVIFLAIFLSTFWQSFCLLFVKTLSIILSSFWHNFVTTRLNPRDYVIYAFGAVGFNATGFHAKGSELHNQASAASLLVQTGTCRRSSAASG